MVKTCCPSVAPETTLTLRDNIIQQVMSDAVQYDMHHDLPCNAQQQDASIVVTGCSVNFAHTKVDVAGVPEVLGHRSLLPKLLHQLSELGCNDLSSLFEDLRRYPVKSHLQLDNLMLIIYLENPVFFHHNIITR